jgi:hypothetical protein
MRASHCNHLGPLARQRATAPLISYAPSHALTAPADRALVAEPSPVCELPCSSCWHRTHNDATVRHALPPRWTHWTRRVQTGRAADGTHETFLPRARPNATTRISCAPAGERSRGFTRPGKPFPVVTLDSLDNVSPKHTHAGINVADAGAMRVGAVWTCGAGSLHALRTRCGDVERVRAGGTGRKGGRREGEQESAGRRS